VESEADELFALVEDFSSSFVPQRERFAASLSELIDDRGALLLGAFSEARIQGYVLAFNHATLFANGPVTWVEELYVRPEVRRRGIARALMQAVEDRVRHDGSRLIALATRRADAFYEALGYEASATYYRRVL
jgi:GNAT superfamily N-acetyltransferase